MQSITKSFLGLLLVFALFIALHTSSVALAESEQLTEQKAQSPFKTVYQELMAFKKYKL